MPEVHRKADVAGPQRVPPPPEKFRRNGASLANRPHHTQELASLRVGGRSIMGFRSKKPDGISLNPQLTTGWTGKSSGRTEWCRPKTCHRTTSVFSIARSAS